MRSIGIIVATASLLAAACVTPRASAAPAYDFSYFFPPIYAGSTGALGVNDAGDIVGYTNYTPSTFPKGYIRHADGSFVNVDLPGTILTVFSGINNAGQIAGVSFDSTFKSTGFVRQPDGTVNPFATGFGVQVNGINDLGQVVGSIDTPAGTKCYVLTGGTMTTFAAPFADGNYPQTFAYGINNDGDLVGQFFQGNTRRSFLKVGDNFTYLDLPGAEVSAYGINDQDDIVGSLKNADGIFGFLLHNGVYTLFNAYNPLAQSWLDVGFTTRGALIYDINNEGVMVGTAVDGRTTDLYNFILTPVRDIAAVPEPGPLPLVALGLLAISLMRRGVRAPATIGADVGRAVD